MSSNFANSWQKLRGRWPGLQQHDIVIDMALDGCALVRALMGDTWNFYFDNYMNSLYTYYC